MILVDSHVHTRFSSDGKDPVRDIVAEAKAKGLYYLATTDHLDYDLKFGHNRSPIPWKHIDLAAYKAEWEESAASLEREGAPLKFRFGIEAGFSPEPQVIEKYQELFERMQFDVVINSVHFVNGWDVYFPNAFFFKSRRRMYGDYLDLVLKSLDAPYEYDIVAHIGYVTRNAPYKKKVLEYADRHHRARQSPRSQHPHLSLPHRGDPPQILRLRRQKALLRLGLSPRGAL